jgi:transposase InsO family protein
MQIKGLHENIYKLYSEARTQECVEKYKNIYAKSVEIYEKCSKDRTSYDLRREFCVISRATYFRRRRILDDLQMGIAPPSKRPKKVWEPLWGKAEQDFVLKIRRENPTYGKAKIAVILKRDHGFRLSESTVGRILKRLMNQGVVTKSVSAIRTKRKRIFKGHAQPWTFKKFEEMKIGERVQVDHMTVTKNCFVFKHFQSWDRKSKSIQAQIYSDATAKSAKKFLNELVGKSPFKILSIQVDGGSEFMADFEEECKRLGIPLIVLPPRRPDYNGGVERGNRIFREEFYNQDNLLANNLTEMRPELEKALWKYNNYRPHHHLHGATPMEYIARHNSLGLVSYLLN